MRSGQLLIVGAVLLGSAGAAGAAQPSKPADARVSVLATYVDITAGRMTFDARPKVVRTPSVADLSRGQAGRPADFGLSFNCAVKRNGGLEDCRPRYATPRAEDAAALTRTLAPLIRMDRETAETARNKAYRVTFNVALETLDASGFPRECRPPNCMIEGAVPPPPPKRPEDPVFARALAQAETCWNDAWGRSIAARNAAQLAQRNSADAETQRALALAFVRSRQTLMACVTGFQQAARALPLSEHDRAVAKERTDGMLFNYAAQNQYAMAILIGLLDKDAAAAELSFPYPR